MSARSGRSVGEQVLGLVAEVRAGEAPTALLMTLNGFLLLMAYSCIKPVREALILAQPGGAEYKVYMAGGTAIILLFAVPAYSRYSRNVSRNRLVVVVTAFFASHLLLFYAAGRLLGPSLPLALGFYLWIAVFNMMIVAQFWAYANDLYAEEAGKRLFPMLGLGASVGAVAGAAAAKALITQVGWMAMLPLAAALLMASAALSSIVHRREVGRAVTAAARETAVRAIGGSTGEAFRAVFAQRYLLWIALFSLVFTTVKTNGDYVLAHIVKDAAARAIATGRLDAHHVQDFIGSFFASYQFWIDMISLAIQAFAVSRIVRWAGIGAAFLVLPFVALADASVMIALPILMAVRIGKTAESAIDYSLNNTVRSMLWLPTSRRAKYLAKQATDTFFVRMGDIMSAAIVFAGTRVFRLPVQGFAAINVVLVLAWLVLAKAILQERARLSAHMDAAENAPALPPPAP